MLAAIQFKSFVDFERYPAAKHLEICFADATCAFGGEKLVVGASDQFRMFTAEQPARGDISKDVTAVEVACVHRFGSALDDSLKQVAAAAQVDGGFVLAVLRDQEMDTGADERQRDQRGS